jgi:hypothetical protein
MKFLLPLVLAIFLVWPPTVQVQEKEPSNTCQNLPDLWKMSKRLQQHDLTDQDKELIQDRKRFVETTNGLVLCSDKLSADEKAQALAIGQSLLLARIEYLEGHERGLVAKYNDLVASHNELVTLATVALSHPNPTPPSSYTWLKATTPISGPVVCRGNTTAMGQGITSIYVNCN